MGGLIARIKELRHALKLSQSEFAEALNLKRNSITLIETGKRSPSDRTIADICREFKVNEEWLRNGTGDMFEPESEELDFLIAKYGSDLTENQRKIVIGMLKMNDAQRAVFDKFIDQLMAERDE